MASLTTTASAVVARPAFTGRAEALKARAVAAPATTRKSVVTLATASEDTSRRAALSIFTVRRGPYDAGTVPA